MTAQFEIDMLGEEVFMPKKSHGKSRTPEYITWTNMISRCEYPNRRDFHRYGGRGIRVCERWRRSFENFLSDMGPHPFKGASLEREDSDGNYCPENCRWATQKEQTRNRKGNVRVTVGDKTCTIGEWSEISGVNCRLIRERLLRGWPPEQAIVPYTGGRWRTRGGDILVKPGTV